MRDPVKITHFRPTVKLQNKHIFTVEIKPNKLIKAIAGLDR